ncbi:hypothetical protein MMC34_002901 [Xylographa carneopallida]|nr:hypothetical protein [Xylographa carneopallida]
MAPPPTALLGISPNHLSRYTTSWLLPPLPLGCLRFLLSLYAFVTTFTILGTDTPLSARQSFSYFTVLTYWGLAFYFLFSGLHTLSYARSGTSWLQRWPRPLQAFHAIFYSTVVTFPFLVTIVFWAVLYRGPWFPKAVDAWSNISQHALNSLFALVEIVLPATLPPAPFHLLFLALLLALYLALAYITYATQGFYVYSFLNPAHGGGRLAGYIIGILVAECIIFGLVWGVIWVRVWLTERILGLEAKTTCRAAKKSATTGVEDITGRAPARESEDVEMGKLQQ